MVLETPVFVLGYDEQSAFPLGTIPERLLHVLQETLTLEDAGHRMLPVREALVRFLEFAIIRGHSRLNERKFRQRSFSCVVVEVNHVLNFG